MFFSDIFFKYSESLMDEKCFALGLICLLFLCSHAFKQTHNQYEGLVWPIVAPGVGPGVLIKHGSTI